MEVIIMCFRPTAASKVITCPRCQKKLTLQPGNMTKTCPFCGADFQQAEAKSFEPPKE